MVDCEKCLREIMMVFNRIIHETCVNEYGWFERSRSFFVFDRIDDVWNYNKLLHVA